MGSGSLGMSGGSGQGGGGGTGGYTNHRSRYSGVESSNFTEAFKNTIQKLKSHSGDYLQRQVTNPMLNKLYKSLFKLNVEIYHNHSWDGIEKIWDVEGDSGCMRNWVQKVLETVKGEEQNEKFSGTARMVFENFIIKALDDDYDAYFSGDSKSIMAKLDQKVFKQTSNNFLGFLLKEVIRREKELSKAAGKEVDRQAQEQADKIIRSFENEHLHAKDADKQITHEEFFDVISKDFRWFKKKLR